MGMHTAALRCDRRCDYLGYFKAPLAGGRKKIVSYSLENRAGPPCGGPARFCVFLDENAMQLSGCPGASPGSRMLGRDAAGRAASPESDLDLVGISLERR